MPKLEDVSMGGTSFDVRRVRGKSFAPGLNDEFFKSREFVVIKQPRIGPDTLSKDFLSEIATELQILQHPPLLKHDNIIDFLAVIYHDSGGPGHPNIIPALVIEYAEFGSLASFQANSYGRTFDDKIDIAIDAAKGLEALHEVGIVHGDIKSSNFLVCRHPTRKFIVKLSDFGFSLSVDDEHLVGYTQKLEAPEANEKLDRRYLFQLDIYSFGLFFHTLIKNGTSYYEIPGEGGNVQFRALKLVDSLATILQLNLLITMEAERCPLFRICKILAYSLQLSPGRRFKAMSQIVAILDKAKPSHTTPADFEGFPNIQQQFLMPLRLPTSVFQPFRDRVFRLFETVIGNYCSSFGDDPLLSMLKEMCLKRASREIDMFLGSVNPGKDHVEFSVAQSLNIQKEVEALQSEPELADSVDLSSNPLDTYYSLRLVQYLL